MELAATAAKSDAGASLTASPDSFWLAIRFCSELLDARPAEVVRSSGGTELSPSKAPLARSPGGSPAVFDKPIGRILHTKRVPITVQVNRQAKVCAVRFE